MVSKDVATLSLLEVGASIRQRYQEQAQKCPLPFLYKAMKLCNDCDMNYRTSKNKRLLVELTLIQVAQLTTGGDDVSGGRSPKQAIKPIFTQPAVAQQPQAAPVGTQSQPAVKPVAQSPTAPASPVPAVGASNQTSTPEAVLKVQLKEEKKIPVMNRSSLGLSIKHPQKETGAQNAAVQTTVHTQVQPEEDYIFNEKDLNYYWQEYAGQLPIEHKAIAMRMQNIRPALQKDDVTFEILVDNEIIAKEFTAMIPEVQDYLRTRLKNRKVRMTVRVSAPAENVRAYSRVEKFQMMAKKNDALMQLKEEFGLELY